MHVQEPELGCGAPPPRYRSWACPSLESRSLTTSQVLEGAGVPADARTASGTGGRQVPKMLGTTGSSRPPPCHEQSERVFGDGGDTRGCRDFSWSTAWGFSETWSIDLRSSSTDRCMSTSKGLLWALMACGRKELGKRIAFFVRRRVGGSLWQQLIPARSHTAGGRWSGEATNSSEEDCDAPRRWLWEQH